VETSQNLKISFILLKLLNLKDFAQWCLDLLLSTSEQAFCLKRGYFLSQTHLIRVVTIFFVEIIYEDKSKKIKQNLSK